MSDYPEPRITQLAVSDLSPRTEVSVWPDGRVEIEVADVTIVTSRDALLAALGVADDGHVTPAPQRQTDLALWIADAEARARATLADPNTVAGWSPDNAMSIDTARIILGLEDDQ